MNTAICFNCGPKPHLHPRPKGKFCEGCRQRVYLVVRDGAPLWVGTWTGRVSCP